MFLCLWECCLKVCLHRNSFYIVFFLFNSRFISQPKDSCINLFLWSNRVVKDIFLSQFFSKLGFILPVLLKGRYKVCGFVKGIQIPCKELFLFIFTILKSYHCSKLNKIVRFFKVFLHLFLYDLVAHIPVCVIVTGISSIIYFLLSILWKWMIHES